MSHSQAPKPVAQGRLSKTPFAHLLLHIHGKGLSGTLAIWPDGSSKEAGFHQDRVLFQDGIPIAGRLMKAVSALDRGLLSLFERKTAPYAFYPVDLIGNGDEVLREKVDPFYLIAAALRGGAQDEIIDTVLDAYGESVIRVRPETKLDRYGFMGREESFLSRLTSGPTTIGGIIDHAKDDRTSRRVLYLLAITKALEPVASKPAEVDLHAPRQTPTSRQTPEHREVEVVLPEAENSEVRRYRPGSVPPSPMDAPPPPPTLTPALQARWQEVTDKLEELDGENFFQMLSVAVDATTAEVQQAYIREVKKWHPDRNPKELVELRPWAERVFQQLTEARDTIADRISRQQYLDSVRGGGGTPEMDRGVQAIVNAAVEVQKAEILYRRKDWTAAEESLRAALSLNEEDPDIHALLGDVLFQEYGLTDDRITAEIMRCLGKALSHHDEHLRALFVKGRVHQRRGQMSEALSLFQKVATLDPRHHEAARELRLATMRGANPHSKDTARGGLFSRFFGKKK